MCGTGCAGVRSPAKHVLPCFTPEATILPNKNERWGTRYLWVTVLPNETFRIADMDPSLTYSVEDTSLTLFT